MKTIDIGKINNDCYLNEIKGKDVLGYNLICSYDVIDLEPEVYM